MPVELMLAGVPVRVEEDRILVHSRTRPGWHDVTEGCSCEGYEHWGRCWHRDLTDRFKIRRIAESSNPASVVADTIESAPWVPIRKIVGQSTMPPDAADIVGRGIDAMVRRGEVTSKARWKALEYWAIDFLLGGSTSDFGD